MKKTLYAVAIKNHGNVDDYDFISTLAHEFEGKDEVVGYDSLEHALHFGSEEDAENVLSEQPEWVRKEHIIVEFSHNTLYDEYKLA